MNKNLEEIILTAIYETEKFKKIAKNYLEVKKIKNKQESNDITKEFKELVLNTIDENLDIFCNEYGIKSLRKKIGTSTLRLKQRWHTNALEKHLNKEIEFAKINYVKTGTVSKEFANVNALKEHRVKFLNAWKNDIILCITEELMNEYAFNIENITIKTPAPVAPSLFVPVKNCRKKEFDEIKYKSKLLTIIEGDEGEQIDYFYEIEKPKENEEEQFKLELKGGYELDQQDLDIIRYAYTYSYHDFNTFNTNDVLKFLGLSKCKSNQERIENKFMKLPRYNFYAEKISPDGNIKSKTVFNLFSGVNITINEETGERIINTAKSNLFRLNPFSMEIMYKTELKKIKSEDSKSVAYFLCKKRKKLSFRQDLLTEYSSNDNINYIIMIIKQKLNEKNKNIKILGGKSYEYFSCRRTRENGERLS